MQVTTKDSTSGMIEICARRKKKVGGKDYLIYYETIAGQVKLLDGRTVEECIEAIEEYFRLAQAYVAKLAENAKNSEDAAKASEVAAKASELAAKLSEQLAEQSKRQCLAAQEHCEQIAADVDAAIERAAYEQITERVVPAVTENAKNEAVAQIVPEVTSRLWAEAEEHLEGIEETLFDEYAQAVEKQDAAIQKCCEENKELILDIKDDLTEKIEDTEQRLSDRLIDHSLLTTKALAAHSAAIDRNTKAIDDTRQEVSSQVARLDQRIDDTAQEINERIDSEVATLNETIEDRATRLSLAHAKDVAALSHTDTLQGLRIEGLEEKHLAQGKEIDRLDARISDEVESLSLAHSKDVASLAHTDMLQSVQIGELERYVKNAVQEGILRFAKEQAVQASINTKLQAIGVEFTQHQLNDAERFSNLSLASVIHTRKLLEAQEERSEHVYMSVLSDIKLAHTFMLRQVYDAQYYLDHRQTVFPLSAFRDQDGNVTGTGEFGFTAEDGQVVPADKINLVTP